MDVLNKFYSTVSSTVSQLSTVLPGNPVTREFEATSHIASAGQGLLWKVYTGYKKSTHQEASIFLLEKRQLDRFSKNERDAILDCVKKGVSQLSRLRHPQILIVQHTLEESRDSLAFATEPVFASLANILGKADNMPSPLPLQIDKFNLYEVEIKYGLLQVAEGLAFLHNDVKLLHHNISPYNIIINKQGAWKIFGFDFCVHNIGGAEAQARYPSVEYNTDLHEFAQPDLDYLAPECGMSGMARAAGDVYSFGMLIYAVYNHGQPLYSSGNVFSSYKWNVNQLKKLSISSLHPIAEDLREIVRMMLNTTPELRPDIHEFMKINFFEDVGVKALNYLDSLFQWDNLQKSQFYKGLPLVIEKLPHRVCLFRVIPCLAKEFVNPTMVPFVLPNVFTIAENCSKEEFTHYILPHLKPVLRLQEPVQILLICMKKMELLLKLTPAEHVKSDVLPVLFRALESDTQQIQELCLSVLPTFASLIDYPSMKNALIPRIKKLCVNTSYMSVRVNCLVCIGKLMEYLEKWLILDDIIPFLPQIPSKEPAVLMSIIGIYKMVLTHKKISIPKETICSKILPFLIPFCVENSLTLNQFNSIIFVIKDMLNRVETEQRVKLEQLSSIQEQQKSLDTTSNYMSSLTNGVDMKNSSIDDEFQNLFEPKSTKPKQKSSTVNKDNKSLSLEDKQRLMQQNDIFQRMQNEPTITPMPVASSSSRTASSTTKDLTSTLINSNLAQINHSTTSSLQPAAPQLKNMASISQFHLNNPNSNNNNNNDTSSGVMSQANFQIPSTYNKVPSSNNINNNNNTKHNGGNLMTNQMLTNNAVVPAAVMNNLNSSQSAHISSGNAVNASSNGTSVIAAAPWAGTNLSPAAFFTSTTAGKFNNNKNNNSIDTAASIATNNIQVEQTKPLTFSEINDFLS